jgi:hypothetical protein
MGQFPVTTFYQLGVRDPIAANGKRADRFGNVVYEDAHQTVADPFADQPY